MHSAVPSEATSVRLPIFISYGRKSHEDKVFAIWDALQARGHDVWIDREGIRPGTDWRRSIYNGIQQSKLFLAFVSEKSIQSEYCQAEIRIAIGALQYLLPICPLLLERWLPHSISNEVNPTFSALGRSSRVWPSSCCPHIRLQRSAARVTRPGEATQSQEDGLKP